MFWIACDNDVLTNNFNYCYWCIIFHARTRAQFHCCCVFLSRLVSLLFFFTIHFFFHIWFSRCCLISILNFTMCVCVCVSLCLVFVLSGIVSYFRSPCRCSSSTARTMQSIVVLFIVCTVNTVLAPLQMLSHRLQWKTECNNRERVVKEAHTYKKGSIVPIPFPLFIRQSPKIIVFI